jgi:hypothetical protein
MDAEYSEAEWNEAAGHLPLKDLDINQVVLLHRHWMWANHQRRRFEELLPTAPRATLDEAFLISEAYAAMYLWYGPLWVVIEGFQNRKIDLRGRLRGDIDCLGPTMKRCRNATFHVPRRNDDARLWGLMEIPDSVPTIARISTGFGRLFIENGRARRGEDH